MDLLIKSAEDGEQLSDDDIREEVDTVMFAVSKLLQVYNFCSNNILST